MADYKDLHGVQYDCKSQYASNVQETNSKMGYHNLSDRANCSKELHGMPGPKQRKQEMGKPGY